MLNKIFEYKFIIMLVLAVILYAALEWQKFKTILFALMLQAKDKAKDYVLKSGEQQENWVVNNALSFRHKRIPRQPRKGFISGSRLSAGRFLSPPISKVRMTTGFPSILTRTSL